MNGSEGLEGAGDGRLHGLFIGNVYSEGLRGRAQGFGRGVGQLLIEVKNGDLSARGDDFLGGGAA